ncbi:MAG: sulfite exporter TauE/SafE family protein [Betaproteobacteria bacterium]|jgi:uncharacterized membrane protein YfcA
MFALREGGHRVTRHDRAGAPRRAVGPMARGTAPSAKGPRVAAAAAALVLWALASGWSLGLAASAHTEGAALAIATGAVVLIAAFVSGIAGFAFSAVAGVAFAYLGVDPVHAVQTMVACSIATQFYGVLSIRAAISWRVVGPMLAGGAATVPLGVWLLLHVDPTRYAVSLGAFLGIYGGYLLVRRDRIVIRGSAWHDAAAGALGGVAGGLAGLPGSFVTVWCSMRGWDKLRQRAVYQPYILVMQIVTMAWLRVQTPVHGAIADDLLFVPFALIGAVGGLALYRRMTNRQFQVAVSVALVVSGVGLAARAL